MVDAKGINTNQNKNQKYQKKQHTYQILGKFLHISKILSAVFLL